MKSLKFFSDDRMLFEILEPYLSPTDCAQTFLNKAVQEYVAAGHLIERVLDVGCGEGKSREYFMTTSPNTKWYGCDIESSPEVNRRTNDVGITNFNGINLPYDDGVFDMVYCNQVFEHVRHPDELLRSIRRVLHSDGIFLLQTSHLEPYHSLSIFNYTPYGVYRVLQDNGFTMLRIQAGIDCYSIIKRRFNNRDRSYSKFFSQTSPLNRLIDKVSERMRYTTKQRNYLKLLYCGQFVVWAKVTGKR